MGHQENQGPLYIGFPRNGSTGSHLVPLLEFLGVFLSLSEANSVLTPTGAGLCHFLGLDQLKGSVKQFRLFLAKGSEVVSSKLGLGQSTQSDVRIGLVVCLRELTLPTRRAYPSMPNPLQTGIGGGNWAWRSPFLVPFSLLLALTLTPLKVGVISPQPGRS